MALSWSMLASDPIPLYLGISVRKTLAWPFCQSYEGHNVRVSWRESSEAVPSIRSSRVRARARLSC